MALMVQPHLELIEPSLYFNSSDGSAARAASARLQFLASTGGAPSVAPCA
ncbi:hypothetical protein [Ilumatobacter sp.]